MDKEYTKEGFSWYYDRYLSANVWATRWKWAFVGQSIIAFALILVISLLVPIKTMVPFPIIVNEDNQLVRVLNPKTDYLPVNEAMAQNDIAKYLRNREGYNPHTLNQQYRQVAYATDQKIFSDFESQHSPQNSESPINVLGADGIRDIKIFDIVFLDNVKATNEHKFSQLPSNVVQVDYATVTKAKNEEKIEHWVAVLSFDYQGIQRDETLAWENWNGFLVTSYRIHKRTT